MLIGQWPIVYGQWLWAIVHDPWSMVDALTILFPYRESSGSVLGQDKDSSSKYWMGKDYVNWIFKDLDTAKRPFNGLSYFKALQELFTPPTPPTLACITFGMFE